MSVDWGRVRALFEQALEVPEEARGAWLADACGEDGALRAEVAGLLEHAARSAGRLEAPLRAGFGALPVEGGRVGAYRVERLLASGGMGSVWLGARADGAFQKQVAIKFIRRELAGPRMAARFERERQVLAPLEHPGIARLLDGGTASDGAPFLVMEYVDGEPIDVHCDRLGLGVRARLELFARACDAVEYAHSRQVVHRDLKPANLLVTAEGTPKLLDFGIAKLLEGGAAPALESLTATGEYVLSPRYASPEQCAGEPVGPASDVYSLGVLLFELLTARLPYACAGSGLVELHRAIRFEEPACASRAVLRAADPWLALRAGASAESVAAARGTTPRGLARALRGDLDRILQTALAKEPARRYASVAELARDVRRHLAGQPVLARGPSRIYRARRRVARHRGPLAAVLAALMLALPLAWRLASAGFEAVTSVEAWSYTPGRSERTPIVAGSSVRAGDDLGVRVASSRPTTLYALSIHGGEDPGERYVVPLRPVELQDGVPSPRGGAEWGLSLPAGRHDLVCARLVEPSPREGLLVFVAREPVRTLERWLADLDAEGRRSELGVSRATAFALLDTLRSGPVPRGRAILAAGAGEDEGALLRAERERYAGLTAAAAAGLEDWALGADVVRFELLCEVLPD